MDSVEEEDMPLSEVRVLVEDDDVRDDVRNTRPLLNSD